MHSETAQGSLGWLLTQAAGYKFRYVISATLNLLGCILGLIPYYVVYRIVEIIMETPRAELELSMFLPFLIACMAAMILKNVSLGLSTNISHKCAYALLFNIRTRLAGHIGRLPLGYFHRKGAGQLKKIMCEDVEILELFLAHNIPEFTGAALSVLTLLCALFITDWRMALATLALPTLGMAVQVRMFLKGMASVRDWYTSQEHMNATMLQYIQGMPLIKAFNHTVESFKQYRDSVENCRVLENKANKKWYLALSVFYAAMPNALVVILPVGSYLYMKGQLPLQTLIFFLLLGPALAEPVMILALFWHHLERIFEAQARIRGVLDEKPLPEPQFPEPPGETLAGEEVSFSYKQGTPVLSHVDFSVAPGDSMALVGPSGAGKTTLARLIPRFWDVNSGSIRLGSADIRNVGTDMVMKQTTFVFQNVQLFNDTVAANLRMAKPDATDEELETAARAARCHEFVSALPQGYSTEIGEKGCFLSGGEKQRLSIARAMLKDAPIIVLDEATAFIDPENEVYIQEAIDALARGKMLIIIAHRLSTITEADEVLVLDKGAVAGRGTHQELLQTSGLYQKMWKAHTEVKGWCVKGGVK